MTTEDDAGSRTLGQEDQAQDECAGASSDMPGSYAWVAGAASGATAEGGVASSRDRSGGEAAGASRQPCNGQQQHAAPATTSSDDRGASIGRGIRHRDGFALCSQNIRRANMRSAVEVAEGVLQSAAESGCEKQVAVLALQEAHSWRPAAEAAVGLTGWYVMSEPDHPCALVVRSEFRPEVQAFGCADRCCYITTSEWLIVNVYAPDGDTLSKSIKLVQMR